MIYSVCFKDMKILSQTMCTYMNAIAQRKIVNAISQNCYIWGKDWD